MTRQERIGLHTNQKRIQASKSIPSIKEITEGKPIFRETHKGLYQYVKFRGEVYSTLLTKHTRTLEEEINDKNEVFKSMMENVKKESNVPKKLPGESFKDYKKRTNQ